MKTEYHPELVDIEVFDLFGGGFINPETSQNAIKENGEPHDAHVLKYIPLLFYDDLQECMLQNLKLLETNEHQLLDPSLLLDLKVIFIEKTGEFHEVEINRYHWQNTLHTINMPCLFNSMSACLNQFNEKQEARTDK
ncbi:MAG: hypothetical protein RBG13Loki_0643 [Promethearchaeota archaeon CR_4]|nr:MAG: hypothetical protein RBG13Loki_0643 [Candidatus Lokiarchaeota archaeon CR_4]